MNPKPIKKIKSTIKESQNPVQKIPILRMSRILVRYPGSSQRYPDSNYGNLESGQVNQNLVKTINSPVIKRPSGSRTQSRESRLLSRESRFKLIGNPKIQSTESRVHSSESSHVKIYYLIKEIRKYVKGLQNPVKVQTQFKIQLRKHKLQAEK